MGRTTLWRRLKQYGLTHGASCVFGGASAVLLDR
jgi:hypothetical protein